MTEQSWFNHLKAQIDDGQYFLAFDGFREAAKDFPDSLRLNLLGALALLRCGAPLEARRLLAPLGHRLESRTARVERLHAAFRDAVAAATAPGAAPADEAFLRFLQALDNRDPRGDAEDEAGQPEILRLVSLIHLEIGSRLGSREDLAHASRTAEHVFALSDTLADGLDAAGLAAMSGDTARARDLATALLARFDAQPIPATDADAATCFRHHATHAGLALLSGDEAALHRAIATAGEIRPRHLPSVVELLRRIALLESAGVAIPRIMREHVPPPSTVVFAGQPLDVPGSDERSFPPELEDVVARRIAAELDALGAEIGFSGASAGAELLFVEAMLERGAEVHLFLPFAQEDFIRHRVAYAGGHWERRFRNACKLASSITHATEEAYLGHDALLRFNNHLIQGMARARSAITLSEPRLLVLWDYAAASGAGSAADFIDAWPEISHLRLIDLDELREQTATAAPPAHIHEPVGARPAPVPPQQPERTIRTMLFADIVGYSTLDEAELPRLWHSLESVRPLLADAAHRLRLVESWGDAIYAVMDTSRDMVDYAFALIDAIDRMNAMEADDGVGRRLQLRIGLHAGPVFEGCHPLTGRPIVYGSHVSRAARIEPVSLPGHVYASQQFVAMLLAEENARRHEAVMTGEHYAARHVCEYLGTLSLAKNYGRQQVYHIRRQAPLT